MPKASAKAASTALLKAALIASLSTDAIAASGAAGCGAAAVGRMTGLRLVLTSPLTRMILPGLLTLGCAVCGALEIIAAGGLGCRIVARDGARLNPMSINSVIRAFRAVVEDPPKTVAMTRSCPRCADATRLYPAALV